MISAQLLCLNSTLFKYKFFLIILIGISLPNFIIGQNFFPSKKYPTQAFRNPLNIPISLVGNFGECRPNHFHSGIDIRTESKENYPVYAVADGFISQVKIEAGGFGNAIYITHANGYTSLYAHLNKFFPELEQFVHQKQYETKSWSQEIKFYPHQFPVRQGKQIAWSGNTGSSQGPHLHLEIRDAKTEAPLNPLLFFNSLKDELPPLIKQLAIYDGNKSIYEQKPTLQKVNKIGQALKLSTETIKINSSKAFLGICGDDFMKIATGTLGIYEMRMYVDGQAFFAWQMDNISYDITRYMNALADYKSKKNNGPWIQLCHKLPNDKLPIYKDFSGSNGIIDLSDGAAKKIKIEVLDTKANKSLIEFFLQGNSSIPLVDCEHKLTCGKIQSFKNKDIEFSLPEEALYDDICFKSSIKPCQEIYSYIYQVHESYVPLHSYFKLYLQPKLAIPNSLKDKIAVVRLPYGNETLKKGKAAQLEKGKVVTTVRDFGNYQIMIDQTPPDIKTTIKNDTQIGNLKKLVFTIKEETTSVEKCVAEVDGQWLRLVQKGNTYAYEIDEHFPAGKHQFTISAFDENKNKKTLTFALIK